MLQQLHRGKRYGTVVEQLGSELKTYWVDNNNLALSPFLQLHQLSHFFIAIIFFEPNKPHISN